GRLRAGGRGAGAAAGGPEHDDAPGAHAGSRTGEASGGELALRPRDVCFNRRRDAEDEDPLRVQEAFSQDRQGQAPRPAGELESHPREEVPGAETQAGTAVEDLAARSRARDRAACREGPLMPRATNAVARKRRKKKVLKQAKGYFGRKHSSYRFANE